MLRHMGILIVIYLGMAVQSSLISADLAGIGRPFLPAALLVLISACCEAPSAILWSGVLGLILDGMSTERLGVQLAVAALLGLSLRLMQPMWRSRSLLAFVAMILLTTFAWRALSPMTQAMLSGRVVDPQVVLKDAARDAAWTAILAGVLILVSRGLVGDRSRNRIMVASSSPRWGTAGR